MSYRCRCGQPTFDIVAHWEAEHGGVPVARFIDPIPEGFELRRTWGGALMDRNVRKVG